LFADGRWGCAWAGGDLIEGPRHRAAIGAALGLTRRVRR
jgi:hypothetical protein